MSKQGRLVDFQVSAGPSGLGDGERRSINQALFASYEPIRLWLKEHPVQAPFRKLLISLADKVAFARFNGHVSSAIGIFEVTETVDLADLRANAGNHQWVMGIIGHALARIGESTGWHSEEVLALVAEMAARTPPLVHYFLGLERLDGESGAKFVPWLSVLPGETRIGVRVTTRGNLERDVTVLSKPGPIFLEGSFPIANSAIRHSHFVLLDRKGEVLARVPV